MINLDIYGFGLGCVGVWGPTIGPDLKAFRKAAKAGVSINEVKKDRNAARAWKAYAAIGKEIMRSFAQTEQPKKRERVHA